MSEPNCHHYHAGRWDPLLLMFFFFRFYPCFQVTSYKAKFSCLVCGFALDHVFLMNGRIDIDKWVLGQACVLAEHYSLIFAKVFCLASLF